MGEAAECPSSRGWESQRRRGVIRRCDALLSLGCSRSQARGCGRRRKAGEQVVQAIKTLRAGIGAKRSTGQRRCVVRNYRARKIEDEKDIIMTVIKRWTSKTCCSLHRLWEIPYSGRIDESSFVYRVGGAAVIRQSKEREAVKKMGEMKLQCTGITS
ncbi:hypothetical protein VTK73DRAFT_1844 [Phialemonium thermophilum]|uniref:Uncharacterized protein n=1 Tax=Phialemonium thermophilum TaxID=223376 RepID=A0ABR3X7G4_9PEZI